MILAIIEMTVFPAKRLEFLQTMYGLVPSIREEKGCLKCTACQEIEDENTFCVFAGWETQNDLDRHLRSDLFEVLLGTKNFLSEPWKMIFNTVSSTSGIETVIKARRKPI